ncbi:MAG: EAL domain-containing protein [Zoogloeaceae bacterium]|nr:EAL domain-containing protein [Zoogloeaceae bacterium]
MDSSIYLGRQPILDQNGALYGYELLFRSARVPNAAIFSDDSAATATVITHAFGELSLGKALDDKKIFINIGEELLFSDVLEFLNPAQVVLEILETIEVTPAVVDRCRELQEAGFTLALDDILEVTAEIRPLLPLVKIVKLLLLDDWKEKAERMAHDLRDFPVQLLAERVETHVQFQKCAALGFTLFQGYFFAHPTVLHGHKMSYDRMTLLTLLNEILDDVDTNVLEETFKKAPGLSINLLRLTNSVAFGRRVQIVSLRHAITLLGRQQIQRWLQLLLFSSPDNRQQLSRNPLLHLAATRACLMEKLGTLQVPEDPGLAEQAFMVGIMSLIPAILEISMEEVLRQLHNLSPQVHQALLTQTGRLGSFLRLAVNLERDAVDELLHCLSEFPGLSVSTLNALHCEALVWSAGLGQSAGGR